ncbi:cAMP-binding domain of CRP or a regulatory subunit of cAMP-dependent protein kinases [Caloramator quimbayensis]|uniref:cAMP-binding domain of CRP or a regulatory subunit of cAMP-dependent protein kinases n=1 Tax=Caloramator quimbayensis TaxID=1147123 RepID=A0A1T4XY37_9CLOT|nr:Crp/Fnr family transcriptional regulator [Caloramator quimbayensis]SKA93965.1 cAMP-binding domain of CRP or a regulatory subunit of cAMP-dependent protein kinases [Caloramator quimbayensis]
MYESLFDNKRQKIMRQYFLNNLSPKGIIKKYKKNELIDLDAEQYIGIVVKGVVSQSIISFKGNEKLLYVLRPGEIFNEMDYFCGGNDSIISRVKENAEVSLISKSIIEEELIKNPQAYRYFIHSITRKFRIVMLQLTNSVFNDSTGRIADALLRLASCSEDDNCSKKSINMFFTHQELANNIGCSRITVTRCLNKFLEEKIISYENKKIIINNPDALKKYIDAVIDE